MQKKSRFPYNPLQSCSCRWESCPPPIRIPHLGCGVAFFFILPSAGCFLAHSYARALLRPTLQRATLRAPHTHDHHDQKSVPDKVRSRLFILTQDAQGGGGQLSEPNHPPHKPSSQEAALLVGHELRQRHPRRRRRRPVRNEPSKTDDTAVAVFALALAAGARECLARVVPPRARLVPRPLAGRPSERARWGGGGRARAARLRWYGSSAPPASPAARMALSSSGGPGGAGRGRAARLPGGGISRAADRRAG